MILTIIVFLVILTVLVIIHEAGHYFVAKKLGIKVEEFGFGFPPRAWGKKVGETIYSLNWLPIGGFVKLYGEDEAGAGRIQVKSDKLKVKSDEKRAFYARPPWQRALVCVAGVFMNVVLAVVIYYVFLINSNFQTLLPLLGSTNPTFALVNQKFVPRGIDITEVAPNSPADKAGIKKPSILLSINNIKITNNDQLLKIVNQNKGKQITLEWFDITSYKTYTATVTPRVSPPKNEGALGIAFDFNTYNLAILSYDTPVQKAFSGFSHAYNMFIYNAASIATLYQQAVKEKNLQPISSNVGGPVMIFRVVGQVVQIPDVKEEIQQILNLAGLLSLSLAFFNVLPIPALDGGRLFFILIEWVTRRKLNPKFESYANSIGMALLLTLIVLVTYKDVLQLIKQ